MFRKGPERLHSKASLSKTRKASKYQIFTCALQSECSKKNRKGSSKMPMLDSSFNNIAISLFQIETLLQRFSEIRFFGTTISQNSSE